MTRDHDRDLGVATTLEREVAPFVVRARPLLRSGPFCLWGEIVSIQHGDRMTFVTLVDAKDVTRTIDARVPSSSASFSVGEMVGLWGRLIPTQPDPSSIEVVFAANRVQTTKGPSHRQHERRELVSRYAHQRRARLRRLRRIAIVTSERSRAVADFERSLAGDGAAPVDLQLFPVALNNPASIAQGLRDACGARPDLIVVMRGGGDAASFLAFREPVVIEVLGAAVASVPTIVAIGHAEDTLELDEIATWTVSTPTAAGALVRRLAFERRWRFPWRLVRWLLWLLLFFAAIAAVAWCSYRADEKPARPIRRSPRSQLDGVVVPDGEDRSRDRLLADRISVRSLQPVEIIQSTFVSRVPDTLHCHA